MQALKQERTAKAILNKDGVDRGQKQRNKKDANSRGSDVEGKQASDAQSSDKAGQPETTPAEEEQTAVLGVGTHLHKEDRPLFRPKEVESVTTYLVESQQAASLVNVADIQHGESINIAPLGCSE